MNPASATGSVQLSVQTTSLFKPSHYHSILPLQCSTTCGKGQRVRQVHCVSKGIEVDDSECPGEKPVTIKGCRRERCAKNRNENQNVPDNNRAKVGDYSWKKGKWSDVSKAMNHFIIDTICMSISQFWVLNAVKLSEITFLETSQIKLSCPDDLTFGTWRLSQF